MISSVTTTTVSTIASTAIVASIGLLTILAFVLFLTAKMLSGGGKTGPLKSLSRVLDVAIVPLLVVFTAITVAKVMAALGIGL